MKNLHHGLVVERQPDAQLAIVFAKRIFALACNDRAFVDDRFGVVGRHALNGGHSTLNADVNSAVLTNDKLILAINLRSFV